LRASNTILVGRRAPFARSNHVGDGHAIEDFGHSIADLFRSVEIGLAREFLPPSGDLDELLFHGATASLRFHTAKTRPDIGRGVQPVIILCGVAT
jgi:hypothetical protein